MVDMLEGLFVNPLSAIIFILGIYIAGVLSSLIYALAFFQGRSIILGFPSIRILPKLNEDYITKKDKKRRIGNRPIESFECEVKEIKYELFVSAPMTALRYIESENYEKFRADVIEAIEHIKMADGNELIYSAFTRIKSYDDLEPHKIGTKRDLRALANSNNYLLIYPTSCGTSALYEAGYAYALRKPSLYLIREGVTLPFSLLGAGATDELVTIVEYSSRENMLNILENHLIEIFAVSKPFGLK